LLTLAEAYDIEPENVAKVTNANVKRVFNI
jgi:Tat protein secretion system quality control protein TatD with DNase activity